MAVNSDFSVSTLTDYTRENMSTLYGKMYWGKSSTEYFTPLPGVKYKERFHSFQNEITPVAYSCGWTGTTTTSFSEREIEVATLKNEASYCVDDLKKKYLSELMARGVQEDSFPWETLILDDLVKQLPRKNEDIIWNGNKLGSEGNYLDLVDGLFAILSGDTSVITGATGTTTVSNIQDQIDAIIDLLPDAISDKEIVIYTSLSNITTYKRYLFNANLYHVNANGPGIVENEIKVPYFDNVSLLGVEMFKGADKYIATVKGNFLMGMDQPGEEMDSDVWFERKDRTVNVFNSWRVGTEVIMPEYVITVNNA